MARAYDLLHSPLPGEEGEEIGFRDYKTTSDFSFTGSRKNESFKVIAGWYSRTQTTKKSDLCKRVGRFTVEI
jgi:hypothetical protein